MRKKEEEEEGVKEEEEEDVLYLSQLNPCPTNFTEQRILTQVNDG